MAILGPSGSGKTTLLSTLAGQVPYTKGMSLTGSITLNGTPQASNCPPSMATLRTATLSTRGGLLTLCDNALDDSVLQSASHVRIGYVQQEDLFFSQLTVTETLAMAAQLRLPESTPVETINEYVDKIIARLG